MESWPVQKIVHRDEVNHHRWQRFSAIARLKLLELLQSRAIEQGVHIEFGRQIDALNIFSGFDLVVGADGVNSMVRRMHAERFQPRIEQLTNKFAWYGTGRTFDCLTLTFRANEQLARLRLPSGANLPGCRGRFIDHFRASSRRL